MKELTIFFAACLVYCTWILNGFISGPLITLLNVAPRLQAKQRVIYKVFRRLVEETKGIEDILKTKAIFAQVMWDEVDKIICLDEMKKKLKKI